MLFKPDLVALILASQKAHTRRSVKEGDTTLGILFGDGTRFDRVRYRVGQSYALRPGRGKHAVGRIAITDIRYCAGRRHRRG
jgi:hypothetical protein